MSQSELLDLIYESSKQLKTIDLTDSKHLDFLVLSYPHFTKKEQSYLLTYTNLFELTENRFPVSYIKSQEELGDDISFYFFKNSLSTPRKVSQIIIDLFSHHYSSKQKEHNQRYLNRHLNLTEINCENLIRLHAFCDINQAFSIVYFDSKHNMLELLNHSKRQSIIETIYPYIEPNESLMPIWLVAHFFHIDNQVFEKKEDLSLFLKLTFDNNMNHGYQLIEKFEQAILPILKKREEDLDRLSTFLSSMHSTDIRKQKIVEFYTLLEKHKMDYYLDETQHFQLKKQNKL